MNRQDNMYNHRIERQKRIDDFPRRIQILAGAALVIGVTGGFIILLMVCRAMYSHH